MGCDIWIANENPYKSACKSNVIIAVFTNKAIISLVVLPVISLVNVAYLSNLLSFYRTICSR